MAVSEFLLKICNAIFLIHRRHAHLGLVNTRINDHLMHTAISKKVVIVNIRYWSRNELRGFMQP